MFWTNPNLYGATFAPREFFNTQTPYVGYEGITPWMGLHRQVMKPFIPQTFLPFNQWNVPFNQFQMPYLHGQVPFTHGQVPFTHGQVPFMHGIGINYGAELPYIYNPYRQLI